jgi:hypothetical protein
MQKKKIILFGNDEALKSSHAQNTKSMLDEIGHEVLLLPKPTLLKTLTDWKNLPFDWAIFFTDKNSKPKQFETWNEVFKQLRHPPFIATLVLDGDVNPELKKELNSEFVFKSDDDIKEILKTLGLKESTQIVSDHYLLEGDLKLAELSEKLFEEKASGIVTGAFLEGPENSGLWKDTRCFFFKKFFQ